MGRTNEYPRLLLLISRQTTDREQNHNQELIQAMIKASNMDDPETVDGSDAQNKDRRAELFEISGLRAKYPQLFIVESAKSKPTFIGDFEKIQGLNESGKFNNKGVLGIDDDGNETPPSGTKTNQKPKSSSSEGTSTVRKMCCCF